MDVVGIVSIGVGILGIVMGILSERRRDQRSKSIG